MDITNIIQDLIVVILAPLVGYVLKFFFKPSKAEVQVIAQILAFFLGIFIKWAIKNKENHPHLYKVHEEVIKLKQNINSRTELG